MIKKIFVIITLICFFLISRIENINANGRDQGFLVNGLGISGDYANTDSGYDGGVFLSYRFGLHFMLSGFINADAGYRFNEESVNGKIGLSAMLFIIGLDFGFAYAYRTRDEDPDNEEKNWGPWAPGAYIGLGILLPFREYPIFLSAGAINYGNGHENEFYTSVTCIINVWGD